MIFFSISELIFEYLSRQKIRSKKRGISFLFKKMSLTETKEQIENFFDDCTDNSNKIAGEEFLEKIIKELEVFLSTETNKVDEADRIFDLLRDLSDSVEEEFEELVAGDSDKKRFIRTLSRIFALLLNTKVDTAKKIKRILKIAIEMTLKIWQEPRQQQEDYLSKPSTYLGKWSIESTVRKKQSIRSR